MNDFDTMEYRQRRLADLVAQKFNNSKAEAGRALGFRDGAYVNQMLKGIRPITEKFIGNVDKLPGLAGWFSRPSSRHSAVGVASEQAPPYLPPIDLEDNPQYPAIRRVSFKLSAGASGFGIEYRDDEGPPIVFQRSWFLSRGYKPEKLFATKIKNRSMEPGLFEDDTVVVNTDATEQKDGRVFALNYEGELVVKRLVRDAGQWWLVSDNPDQTRYPRKACHDNVFVLGEIVHKQSERI